MHKGEFKVAIVNEVTNFEDIKGPKINYLVA